LIDTLTFACEWVRKDTKHGQLDVIRPRAEPRKEQMRTIMNTDCTCDWRWVRLIDQQVDVYKFESETCVSHQVMCCEMLGLTVVSSTWSAFI